MSQASLNTPEVGTNVDGAANDNKPKPSYPAPFSIRLSGEERAYLEGQAGNKPLGVYIRAVLLEERAAKRRILRKPTVDHQQIATVLATLGDTRLSSNLNQLAKHANMGTLAVSRDIEQELEEAYQAVIAMRNALFIALGAYFYEREH